MAKMKNLFVGCPVVHKKGDPDNLMFVAELDQNDATAYCASGLDGGALWYAAEGLRIGKYPEPDKVIYRANRQLDKQAATV